MDASPRLRLQVALREARASSAVGVGQDKEPRSPLTGANRKCVHDDSRSSVSEPGEVVEDDVQSWVVVEGRHVFEEDPARADVPDDPLCVWPDPSWVGRASECCVPSVACSGKGSTRDSCSDAIHCATPCSAAEGRDIVPDRRDIQGLVFHPRHESGRGFALPLDITNSSGSGVSELESEFESADAGAEREDARPEVTRPEVTRPGTCNHVMRRLWTRHHTTASVRLAAAERSVRFARQRLNAVTLPPPPCTGFTIDARLSG